MLDVDFYEQTLNEEYQNYVKISVIDSGIGIKKEDIPKIFDKFQQIENSLSREVGGTGLGLPIAKQLTQAHQGLIWLESQPDEGSCFNVAIPVMDEYQIFKTDLNRCLCNSKQMKKRMSFVMLKEFGSDNLNRAIKDEKLVIFKNSTNYKGVQIQEGSANIYLCFMQDIDEYALDFAIKKIQSYVKTDMTQNGQGDIMYSKADYPKDGLTFEALKSSLEKGLKNIKE